MPVKQLRVRFVYPTEVQEFLQDPQWTLDEDLTQQRSKFNRALRVYKHADGRILDFIEGKAGRLYASQEAFNPVLRGTYSETLDEGELRTEERADFVNQVPELITTLPALIEISEEALDYSLDSLAKVEEAVKRTGWSKSLQPPLFEALVAYVGEVLRRAKKGVWETRKSGRVWTSWVSISERAYHDPIDLVYNVFEQNADNAEYSLQAAVRGELSFGRLKPEADKSSGADVIRKADQ